AEKRAGAGAETAPGPACGARELNGVLETMAVEIRVPQLGESVVEATIGRWLKQEGDAVAAGDVLVELETDKINVEVPSEQAGVLQRILHQAGETVGVNEPLAVIGDSAVVPAPT